ncbi:MAG: flagellar basal body-associated FliL family protein [Candidatus Loosdrechtia sp.]|uniref:flagellar basal body-associated FliL family protein n=1 Tax=Candidatus Loosdrechtia sp. TaxID=3101272 RepID=UPI003A63F7C8|nr:MAG: flagellar basal body-associated FliL family protein [Candidatus Jettenia sp. AMX2]
MENKRTENTTGTVETKGESVDTARKSNLNMDMRNMLVMIVIAVVSVGCAFVLVSGVYSFKSLKKSNEGADNKVYVPGSGETPSGNAGDGGNDNLLKKILVPMDSIVVNLGNVENRRFLRVIIALEISNSETEKVIQEKKVIFRDKLISFLSKMNARDIGIPDGQLKLRTEIKDILNKEFFEENNIITQVYFSDFVIQ